MNQIFKSEIVSAKPAGNSASIWTLSQAESFFWQESIFAALNVLVLIGLLAGTTLFAEHFGTPNTGLVVTLLAGIVIYGIDLAWLFVERPQVSRRVLRLLTWGFIFLNLALAAGVAVFVDRKDSPFTALLVGPLLLASFRLSVWETILTILLDGAVMFFSAWHFFRYHAPVDISEYFEAGTLTLIFLLIGMVVWELVDSVKKHERQVAQQVVELAHAQEHLAAEERLAAVGRLSAAIAHEIRNPVAMIASSLATATDLRLDAEARCDMFAIATKEAQRLERLTNDFLAYARPRLSNPEPSVVAESLGYVADICRAHATQKGVAVRVESEGSPLALMDSGQIQQALLNLTMNAIDASRRGGEVLLRSHATDDSISIDVENGNGPVPPENLPRIFEPFFTTKASGTGLGLAIAGNIVRSNRGTLQLTHNSDALVRFTMTLPLSHDHQTAGN
jgi:signal transduction histidine kinase